MTNSTALKIGVIGSGIVAMNGHLTLYPTIYDGKATLEVDLAAYESSQKQTTIHIN